jgi:serine/threonine protein kinase/Tol biopolymer transport system component
VIGRTISHYRIEAKLGEGGMGEVYRAHDMRLDRDVALKILPADVAANPERCARFERESRAIAAINHPNIVTIHSVEEADGLVFFTMELVDGQTLAEVIPEQGFSLPRFFQIAIPLTEALCSAHDKGITHRDLKPTNVLLDREGRVKVLDFGLARLASPAATGESATVPMDRLVTEEGRILGTVAYMSPEQAEGRPVDHRSDVFSLGILLYEMLTGQRPFAGDSRLSTLTAILRDTPPSVTELKHSLPRHLGRIIKRCLAKDPQRRYQTVRDLHNELLELKREIDSGELETPAVAIGPARRRLPTWAIALLGAVAILGPLLVWRLLPGRESEERDRPITPETLTITPLTQSGDVRSVALSPDGRYLAYSQEAGDRWLLRVKQIAVGSEMDLMESTGFQLHVFGISPDDAIIYYTAREEDSFAGTLHRIPLLGGMPRKIGEGVEGSPVLSPDGERIIFARGAGTQSKLVVVGADGTDEHELGALGSRWTEICTWLPDATQILVADATEDGTSMRLHLIPLAGGERRPFGEVLWTNIASAVWLPGASGFLVAGQSGERRFHDPMQVHFLPYPTGPITRLTSGLSDYFGLSCDRSGWTVAAIQTESEMSLWVLAAGDEAGARRIALSPRAAHWYSMPLWTPDGRIIFEQREGKDLDLWISNTDGTDAYPLISEGDFNMGADLSPDGRHLAFFSDRSGSFKIWLSDIDGSNARRLTADDREEYFPRFSPDGEWVVYHSLEYSTARLRRAPVAGGKSELITDLDAYLGSYTSDGQRVVCVTRAPEGEQYKITLLDVATGAVIKRYDGEFRVMFRLNHERSRIDYIASRDGVDNIWSQSVDGGAATQLTHFAEGRLIGFGWSARGDSLAVSRYEDTSDAVLLSGFRPK